MISARTVEHQEHAENLHSTGVTGHRVPVATGARQDSTSQGSSGGVSCSDCQSARHQRRRHSPPRRTGEVKEERETGEPREAIRAVELRADSGRERDEAAAEEAVYDPERDLREVRDVRV